MDTRTRIRMRKGMTGAVVLVTAAFALTACGSDKKDSSSSDGGDTVTVQVGLNDPQNRTVAVLQYMPAKVTVKAGSTVRWTWAGTIEPHSVTFFPDGQQPPSPDQAEALFAPTPAKGPVDRKTLVNSGLAPLGPQPVTPLDLTFSAPGVYTYNCVIHPQMVGTVEVI